MFRTTYKKFFFVFYDLSKVDWKILVVGNGQTKDSQKKKLKIFFFNILILLKNFQFFTSRTNP